MVPSCDNARTTDCWQVFSGHYLLIAPCYNLFQHTLYIQWQFTCSTCCSNQNTKWLERKRSVAPIYSLTALPQKNNWREWCDIYLKTFLNWYVDEGKTAVPLLNTKEFYWLCCHCIVVKPTTNNSNYSKIVQKFHKLLKQLGIWRPTAQNCSLFKNYRSNLSNFEFLDFFPKSRIRYRAHAAWTSYICTTNIYALWKSNTKHKKN